MMTKTVLHVEGMSCKSCAAKIKLASKALGAKKVQVDLVQKQVEIEHDTNSLEAILLQEHVEKLGYKVVEDSEGN
ncbi:heavy-metal-associated domain-containing protein [Brevibacillus sp. 7WMA2]|uniref:heavy-metal-associated domain-containing protein n=1 Tax=Brevibacillus sp. 7WMA2 TaxID=2683193 RepID=UPI0013A7420D|nr:heavy-metal-associated domain-containing protein [Brevibacillus sp. 7WMA2]QIC04309.1 heavy-metal-associated domain-containing protein [Brevibacillus sp. 7WMA2]